MVLLDNDNKIVESFHISNCVWSSQMHFTKHHNISDVIIKTIEICDRSVLRNKEHYWIQELNTAFPYGLNSRVNIQGIHDSYNHVINNNPKAIYYIFNQVKNNRTKKGSGINRKIKKLAIPIFNTKDFIESIVGNVGTSIANICRELIMNLQMQKIKILFLDMKLQFNNTSTYQFNEYLLLDKRLMLVRTAQVTYTEKEI